MLVLLGVALAQDWEPVAIERESSYESDSIVSSVISAGYSVAPDGNVLYTATVDGIGHLWSHDDATPLVSNGDPVPGRPTLTFAMTSTVDHQVGRVYANGDFAFTAGVLLEDGSIRLGLFAFRDGELQTLMIPTDARPDGGVFGDLLGWQGDGSGHVVFTESGLFDSGMANWLWDDGDMVEVAPAGAPVDDVFGATWTEGQQLQMGGLLPTGEFAFIGAFALDDGSFGSGVFRQNPDGFSTPIELSETTPTTRGPLSISPAVAPDGVWTFTFFDRDDSAGTEHIEVTRVSDGAQELAFRSDQAAWGDIPSTANVSTQVCGARGRLLVTVQEVDAPSYWRHEQPSTDFIEIVEGGTDAPSSGGTFPDRVAAEGLPHCTASGTIYFRAGLDGVDPTQSQSLWRTDSNGVPRLVAQAGDVFDVTAGTSRETFFVEFPAPSFGGSVAINDDGVLVMTAAFTEPAGTSGIFRLGADSDGIDVGDPDVQRRCGCATARPTPWWLALFAPLAALRRRS